MHTVKHRRMPLDPEPAENGNVLIAEVGGEDVATVLSGHELAMARAERKPLFLSHFATCPNARQHRGRPRDAAV